MMESPAFGSLLDGLAARGGDELERILTFLTPVDRAGTRRLNRAICAVASADSLWAPVLAARGFTPAGCTLWAASGGARGAPRTAFELYGRVHQREACEVELMRRSCSRAAPRRWWAEVALDLLNPFDSPVWLFFSAARDESAEHAGLYAGDEETRSPGAPSYLTPVGGAGRVQPAARPAR